MRSRALNWILGATFAVGAAVLLGFAMLYAETERTMGDVQRIFYFHVPSAINAALAYVVAAGAGAGYLATRRIGWDQVGRAAVETGTLWATIMLVTGPIWARSAWGTWWTWEPRLTTSLIAWLILLGALLVRQVSQNAEQAARLGSVIAIIGCLNLPIVYKSVDWWRGNHPMIFRGGEGSSLAPSMLTAFLAGIAGVTLMHAALFVLAWRTARAADEVMAAERLAEDPR
ncbi:MAG: cytochrome c biogenesis protein CcsA [Acidobacteria bacterium]|nr:cytochrome c biogenesis protein CcsA [Acidobacteriota bacterium]